MAKTIWQKIRRNHLLLMVLCCLAPIILIIGFLAFFKGSNYWIWLIILLCPVLHIWMMKQHGKGEERKLSSFPFAYAREKELYQCSECGFWYEEKKWAKKCQAWCKEHRSCNLEITKHAFKKNEKRNF